MELDPGDQRPGKVGLFAAMIAISAPRITYCLAPCPTACSTSSSPKRARARTMAGAPALAIQEAKAPARFG